MNIPESYASNETLAETYKKGFNHGHGIACHNVPEMGESYRTDSLGRVTVDADNIREVHQALVYEAESNSRQYSPFEFTAHEFNSLDDEENESEVSSEEVWEAFEAGINDAIAADLSTYTDENYGIKSEE